VGEIRSLRYALSEVVMNIGLIEFTELDNGLWLCVVGRWCGCIGTSMADAAKAAVAEYKAAV